VNTVEGVIESFDDLRGDGFFRSDHGELLYFHCVAIADGSRTIAENIRARGRRATGHLGSDELVDVAAS
jgi:cold shock CspA family protein